MIPLHELRIGNYFISPHGYIEKCTGVLETLQAQLINPVYDYSSQSWVGFTAEQVEPVPLALPVLRAAGFEPVTRGGPEDDSEHTSWEFQGISLVDDEHGEHMRIYPSIFDMTSHQVPNLHTLQNFCFLIRGVELVVSFPRDNDA